MVLSNSLVRAWYLVGHRKKTGEEGDVQTYRPGGGPDMKLEPL
jgi:hypothetical protein